MAKISLSQLLRRIAALKFDLATWTTRLPNSAKYVKDSSRAYTYEEIIANIKRLKEELIAAKTAQAIINATTIIKYHDTSVGSDTISITIAEAVLRLAELKDSITLYSKLVTQSAPSEIVQTQTYINNTYVMIPTEYLCVCTTRERDNILLDLRERFAALNAAVEAANHTTFLEI